MQIAFIYITVPTEEDAKKIGKKLVESRLVACYNITPTTSGYMLPDGFHEQPEWVLLCKTIDRKWDAIVDEVDLLHPYERPCIAKYMIETPHKYFNWMKEVLGETMKY